MAGYGTDQGLTEWLTSYGYTLPADAPTPAVLRQRGSDYVDGLYAPVADQTSGYAWGGDMYDAAQERQFPRTTWGDIIPAAIVNASYMAAYIEANDPGSLSVTGSASGRVVRERVEGAVEVQYANPGNTSDFAMDSQVVNTTIFGMVKPYLVNRAASPAMLLSIGC
jgi:hypothetical protein